jgi:hypothetical protein
LNTGFGDEEEQKKIKELLHVETPIAPDDSGQYDISVTFKILYQMKIF